MKPMTGDRPRLIIEVNADVKLRRRQPEAPRRYGRERSIALTVSVGEAESSKT